MFIYFGPTCTSLVHSIYISIMLLNLQITPTTVPWLQAYTFELMLLRVGTALSIWSDLRPPFMRDDVKDEI